MYSDHAMATTPQMQGGQGPSTNPYDFILNENPKPKRSLLPGGNSKTTRILIVVGILAVIFIIGIMLFTTLSASNSSGTTEMLTAAQQQQEIARIADMANEKSHSAETKNVAITTAETMRSDQLALTNYLKKNKKKVSTKELALGKNTKSDAELTTAEQANHFDSTLTTILATSINEYQKTLKDAHDHTSSVSGKKLLEQMYTHASTLAEKLQKINGTSSP